MDQGEPQQIVPAATVVIFRHGKPGHPAELLMVTRSKTMSFAGGMVVFPGGRVDPADETAAAQLVPDLPRDEGAARIAAIRETLEETGLVIGVTEPVSAEDAVAARAMLLETLALQPVLERFGWSINISDLVPFARWLPRFRHQRSFDTRFYLYDLGTGAVDIAVDATENTRMFWASAKEALAMAARGEIGVIYPTQRNLERLAQFATYAETRAHADAIPVRIISPEVGERDGARVLSIPEDAGYPVTYEKLDSAMRG